MKAEIDIKKLENIINDLKRAQSKPGNITSLRLIDNAISSLHSYRMQACKKIYASIEDILK